MTHRRLPTQLPPPLALLLLASIVIALLAGSSAPTPLYAIYQAQWHFSPITTTIVFGVYALAVLASLLVVGSLSDHVGRRPVLLAALSVQIATMVVFANASGIPELLTARVLQGLSTGAAVGAIGAGMLDIDKVRGTLANAVAPITGSAIGALLAGILVQYLPLQTRLIYYVVLGVFVLQALGVLFMAETSSRRPGAVTSLKVHLAVPAVARTPFLIAVPALVAIWALAGFYGSLGPSLTRIVVGSTSAALGGLALFVLAGSGAITVLLLDKAKPRTTMMYGTVALIIGVAGTLIAVQERSSFLFFFGTAVAGTGFGAAFQGAVRSVVPMASPHQRAGLLSTLYVVCYLAMGLPAVVGGYLVVHDGGLLTTAREYGAAVIALAALALAGLIRTREAKTPATQAISSISPEPALTSRSS